MTKSEIKAKIKAELRRSALEDESPSHGVHEDAWLAQKEFRYSDELFESPGLVSIFFLLVAEAL